MKNNFHIKTKAFEVQGIKIPAFEISVKSEYTLDEVKVLCHHSDISTTSSYAKNHDMDTINEMFGFS